MVLSSTYAGWWAVHVVIIGGVNAWWWLRDRVERYAIISIIVGLDSQEGFDVVVGVQSQRASVRICICCKANAHTVVPSRHLSFFDIQLCCTFAPPLLSPSPHPIIPVYLSLGVSVAPSSSKTSPTQHNRQEPASLEVLLNDTAGGPSAFSPPISTWFPATSD
jgi:hypothetical protein